MGEHRTQNLGHVIDSLAYVVVTLQVFCNITLIFKVIEREYIWTEMKFLAYATEEIKAILP